MKTVQIIIGLLLMTGNLLLAQDATEVSAIKKVIQNAYVDGIHNQGSIDEIRKGFHPGFELLIKNQNGQLVKLPIYSWIETVEKRKQENPQGPENKTTAEFLSFDITGDAAVAKFDLNKAGKKLFTDYLFLYNFEGQWRIVSKIYQAHE
jgi:hypothetical protein